MEDHQIQKTRTGLDRIARAFDISLKGLRAAWLEKAFRQEVALSIVLVPLALVLGRSWVETMMMLMAVGLVLICEIANSALEAVVDRIGPEFHELSGRAKDLGSAMVLVAIVLCVLAYGGVILGHLRA
ncbi:MAG: diacylglycerol kinase [Burkholderiales bacterium]|nr:diacylglycerol kinase [Burkholderiales bacterium]